MLKRTAIYCFFSKTGKVYSETCRQIILDLEFRKVLEKSDELVLCNNIFFGLFCSFKRYLKKWKIKKWIFGE